MTRRQATIPPDYFDGLYASAPDPWRFASSDYERGKYAATLNTLGQSRYRNALEIGCSIGIFTHQLATRCDALLAIDASAIAIESARKHCVARRNVSFEIKMVPDGFPGGNFDLIVLSEVLYYLSASDLDRVAHQCIRTLAPGGEIILCHWLGETDYPLTGDEAHDLFVKALGDRWPVHRVVNDDVYRLERLSKR